MADAEATPTQVVNVRVQYIRPMGYDNLDSWMQDPCNLYIGRAGVVFVNGRRFPPRASKWANPFKVSKTRSRGAVVAAYEKHIRAKIKQDGLEDELLALRGKKLGCWCHPEACHGDVLARIVDELWRASARKEESKVCSPGDVKHE
eukprot:CAMPEP_0206005050 /NCGR_PEP_ID=MMETSP1464-20131121/4343_1 /ASSEMBLY_ACC=CAM_ASM_001124 /TAXON_ID=119497 /ORGANISM="Exanthemachrysis gayraliae, Strain RCC1523" /LENGTH=145 /DNA_ID=CAMNT_0053378473 /DNA_START=47 /DNA_END=484 /DNA_ORIENTATION=+